MQAVLCCPRWMIPHSHVGPHNPIEAKVLKQGTVVDAICIHNRYCSEKSTQRISAYYAGFETFMVAQEKLHSEPHACSTKPMLLVIMLRFAISSAIYIRHNVISSFTYELLFK